MERNYIILIVLLYSTTLFGQGELDSQDKIFYRNERTIAFLLNTNGVGCNYRYAKRVDGFRKTLYEAEMNYVKHPREIKTASEFGNFIYGKLNSVYTIKGALGFQKEIFEKKDLGGISIRYFTNLGLSIAALKPVYFEYYDQAKDEIYNEKFQVHPSPLGRGPFTMGFDEMSLSPGLYGKIGFSFEYSKLDEVFHALELGVAFDAYAREVNIMQIPAEKILFIFPDNYFKLTFFFSYRFGKVIDTHFNPRRTAIDDMIVD